MKISSRRHAQWYVCFVLVTATCAYAAEIYKWVDEQGVTHYSADKSEAEKAKSIELKIAVPPSSALSGSAPPSPSHDRERPFKPGQAPSLNQKPFVPPVFERPESLSDGKSDGTDAGNCNLARDVLSGAVKHRNGASIDSYDRQVAEDDVHRFCGK